MATIKVIKARQIFDSRGNPTVEVDVTLSDGTFARAAVPSGASTGIYEALELRDGGSDFLGKGVLKAVENVNAIIAPALIGKDPTEQVKIDNFMVQQLDGTVNEWGWCKQKLGANAILAVSLAVCKAGAMVNKIPLYKHIANLAGNKKLVLPVPAFNGLTFWMSNTVVLREIISQAFGNSCHSSPVVRFSESNGSGKKSDGTSLTLKWKGSSGGKQVNKLGFVQFVDDWQETRTFTSALEKVESWIFSRIVESVWWQTLTPHMQPPVKDSYTKKTIERLLGPALGDQQQGSFSINLWKNAFQDAFQRLCPVRAGGHECGCLPVIARMVMEQCVSRLDVAMFNAILRESAHEIPTDPISDPIVDSKVLPIPAGDLSFGSGAQLKNSVGTWSRWLTDLFGMDVDDSLGEVQINGEDGESQGGHDEPKSFHLLNALSDLLMLPKDMLMDRSIRKEVCPSISLPLLKRILCNFTPDEFCPDPVPGAVLEAVNAESIVERRLSADSASSFPYPATPVLYAPPSSADVAEKVAEAGGKSQLARNASMVQKKGYTSDEELEELDSPLTSIIEKMPPSPSVVRNGNGKHSEETGHNGLNARYELLREVWSS